MFIQTESILGHGGGALRRLAGNLRTVANLDAPPHVRYDATVPDPRILTPTPVP